MQQCALLRAKVYSMVASVYVLLPFQGVGLPFYLIPRALPWAMECCPFRAQPFLHWLWLWLSLRPPTVGSFQSLTVSSSLFVGIDFPCGRRPLVPFSRRPLVLHSSLFVLHLIFLFSFVRSEKCDIFAVGQVGGLCRKRMMPMRPSLSPRRAFCRFFSLQPRRSGWVTRHDIMKAFT